MLTPNSLAWQVSVEYDIRGHGHHLMRGRTGAHWFKRRALLGHLIPLAP